MGRCRFLRITNRALDLGFLKLDLLIWRRQSNDPVAHHSKASQRVQSVSVSSMMGSERIKQWRT